MEEAVEDGGRHHGVAKYRSPLADRAIAGDQHAAPLVAPQDELKEQMRPIGLERQVTELVDDQQLGLAEMGEGSSSLPSLCALASWATKVGAGTNCAV